MPLVVLVQPGRNVDVTDPIVKTQVARIVSVLAKDKDMHHVISAFNTPAPFPDPFLISRDRRSTDERMRQKRPLGHATIAADRGLHRQLLVGLDGLDEAAQLGGQRCEWEGVRAIPIDGCCRSP